jgi:hypothetical protein
LLSDFGWNSKIEQKRRLDVAELKPSHATKGRCLGCRSEYSLEQVPFARGVPVPVGKGEVLRVEL